MAKQNPEERRQMKIGDRVRVVKGIHTHGPPPRLIGKVGRIYHISSRLRSGTLALVLFDHSDRFACYEDELEIIPTSE